MDITPLAAFSGLVPVLAVVSGLIASYLTLEGWLFFQRRKRKRSPLVRGLLRSPGESLRKQLDDYIIDMFGFFFLAVISPLVIFSTHISQSYFGGRPETLWRICFSLLLAGGITVYAIVKVVKCFGLIRRHRLGLECELSVGQELSNLQALGYRVFHDFPAGKFNIDHVVIGKNGVFAVETKGRSKPMRGKGIDDARVILNDDGLKFPTWTEKEPLEQARRQAQWLQNFLTSAVGDEVRVTPSLALPGWFVELRTRSNILVYNGRTPEKSFPKFGTPLYDESFIQRIAHQVEQRCRDVEPRSDRNTKGNID